MEEKPWVKYYDYNVPQTIQLPQFPVHTLLHVAAATFPHKASTSFFGAELTFRQIRARVLRFANALIKMGVSKGDRVGIALPNCPQYVIAYYGILSAGAIVVNMNPMYTGSELRFVVENSGMETLVTFDEAMPVARFLAAETALKRIIVTRLSDFLPGAPASSPGKLDMEEGWVHFSEVLTSADESMPSVAVGPEDPALIQYTGGTTGVPKGALLLHRNVLAAVVQSCFWGNPINALVPHAERSVIGVIPYFHIYGNTASMNWAMMNAATQVLIPKFELEQFLDTLGKFDRITSFPAVPTMITAILNHPRHPRAAALDLGTRIRVLGSGGAPMSVELIQNIKDLGIFFYEGWGMTETSGAGIGNPLLRHKAGSVGIPVPNNDVRLVDVETGLNEVAPGEPGEILIKGPSVMKEYWNNPAETAGQIREGWLSTGDIASTDGEGYFYIVDRKKDMIIAGGFNIYPREVDEVLYRHPKIAEAVTVGIPDAYRGETVKAFIVLKPGEAATDRDIIAFCRENLAAYKVPKLVEFRTEIPKSGVGKILRKILRDEEIARSNRS